MAEAVISTLLKIGIALGNEAVQQASSQFVNFVRQIEELQGSMDRIKRELRLIHGFLCQMDVGNLKNENYGIWVQELRMIAHKIEDNVDEYLYLVGDHDTGWGTYIKKEFKRSNVLRSLNRIASFVKEAEDNLKHHCKAKDRWVSTVGGGNFGETSHIVERSQHLASISCSLGEEELVGLDKDRAQLKKWLLGMNLERSVMIVLHGMGGLGKTVLAANIYMKERKQFNCHAWVSISQTYSTKDVLKRLITELHKETEDTLSDITNLDIQGLHNKLRMFLEDKKYLIILDDVWTPEAFHDLSRELIHNKKGSRLIITTREGAVGTLASPDRMLKLETLPADKAWDLFCKTAFANYTNHKCPKGLKPLSEKIVRQCKGLPLAIVSVGSLMRVREKTVEEWKRISDQLSWELTSNPMLSDVRNVLHLSYIYLPTHLKSCFLYCSLFPEDYIFQRKKLARLWIAEGFIEERDASTLEEVAEGYMKELVHRNMLQLVGSNTFGRIKKFKMHDILRELAADLCRNGCFGVTYDEDKCGGSLEQGGRRLVVHKLKKGIEQSMSSVHQFRSIIALDNNMPSITLLPLLSEKSRYMAVLELSGLPIKKIPNAIGDLFNLRHLSLRGSKVKKLPKSVQKLLNLLTLDLHNSDVHKLPSGIVKLKKLRHLFAQKFNYLNGRFVLSSSGVSIGKGLGNLKHLQTLQALVAEDKSVRELGELRQLRSLRLLNVKTIYCADISESVVQMQFLSFLEVNASDGNEVLRLNALPPNLQKLRLGGQFDKETFQTVGQNLYSLRLTLSRLIEDPLPYLSRLTNLMELHLNEAYNGKRLVFQREWFPNLKTLQLRDLPHLERLEIEKGTMVTLEKLLLINLNSMTEVPPGIESLVTLQYLGFHEINRDFLKLLGQCPRLRSMTCGCQYILRD